MKCETVSYDDVLTRRKRDGLEHSEASSRRAANTAVGG